MILKFAVIWFSCAFTSCDFRPISEDVQTVSDDVVLDTLRTEKPVPVSLDTVLLQAAFEEEDVVENEYLINELEPIRANFKRINSTTAWTGIDTVDLWESTEGGLARYYYSNDTLHKIIVRQFGETFQYLAEYYLLNAQLSFVFEKRLEYNRPIYWDSTAMLGG